MHVFNACRRFLLHDPLLHKMHVLNACRRYSLMFKSMPCAHIHQFAYISVNNVILHKMHVSNARRRYGLMFKSVPRALFITLEDRGRVFRILKNWPERNVQMVRMD
jgi:hypothetical protein